MHNRDIKILTQTSPQKFLRVIKIKRYKNFVVQFFSHLFIRFNNNSSNKELSTYLQHFHLCFVFLLETRREKRNSPG